MRATWHQVKDGTVKGIDIELTRRNLLALLAKLDGHPAWSACTIAKAIDGAYVTVRAVENEAHYADVPPGVMHRDTEQHMLAQALDKPLSRSTFAHDLTDAELRERGALPPEEES